MSTARRRLDNLHAAHVQRERRRGECSFNEDIRAMMTAAEGQAEPGTTLREGLCNEIARRL